MLKWPRPSRTLTKFRNKNEYYEYHENFRHTTSDCWELQRALHELADRGQLKGFLKLWKGVDRDWHEIKTKENDDSDRNTEIIATVIGGIVSKKLNARYRKAQIRQLSQVMATKELKPLMWPTMIVSPYYMRPLQTPHNDALVIQLKIATAMTHWILVDIITL